jgi:hypothetical protein
MCRKAHGAAFGSYVGVLDDDPGVRPVLHMFVADIAPWYEIEDRLPQCPGDA